VGREIGFAEVERLALSNLGGALAGLGAYADAESNLQRVLQMAGDSGWFELPNTYRFLAEAYLGQGQADAARDAAQRALELAQQMEAQDLLGRAWRALGLVAEQMRAPIDLGGSAYDAPACFAESLRIFDAKQAEGERARTLRAWGCYEMERGDSTRGASMWQEAREVFARLRMEQEVQRMESPEGG
jgi:tetratricopeptide (TPR) repeat protein